MIFLFSTFRTVYCDEAADESSGVNVHQPTAFAHKLLQLSGVTLFWDEFSASAKSSPVCSAAPAVRTRRACSPRHGDVSRGLKLPECGQCVLMGLSGLGVTQRFCNEDRSFKDLNM